MLQDTLSGTNSSSHAIPSPSATYETKIENDKDVVVSETEEQDGGYGWVCVLAQLLITAHTWGVNGVS